MNEYLACEMAYNNGFEEGKNKTGICTRIEVAYEQLGKVHTELCHSDNKRQRDDILYDIQDILNAILKLEVKLGMLKSEDEMD